MINLARNPYPSAAAMNSTTGLFSIAPGTGAAFQPQLSTNPPDWSLAIVYKNAVFSTSDYFIGMDANDTVYAGTNAASSKIVGLSAYGGATPSFAAAGAGTTTRQIAPDALGNIWVANNATLLTQYSATAGTITNTYTYTGGDVYGVAVDKANNVWVGNAVATTPNVTELAYPGYAINYTSTAAGTFEPVAVFIDGNQNIWTADYFTNGNLASVLANLTPGHLRLATPPPEQSSLQSPSPSPAAASRSRSGLSPMPAAIAWFGMVGTSNQPDHNRCGRGHPGIDQLGDHNDSTLKAWSRGTTLNASATGIPSIDGAGTLFLSDNIVAGIHVYSTMSSTTSSLTGGQVISPPSGYLACYLSTAATTTCGTGSGVLSTIRAKPQSTAPAPCGRTFPPQAA